MAKVKFAFEDLEIWQKAVDFARLVIDISEGIDTGRKHYRLIEQLEASATSIALNIAEGRGRYSRKEYIQFLYIARGSLYETITLMTLFYKNRWITEKQLDEVKVFACEIGKMLSGLVSFLRRSLT